MPGWKTLSSRVVYENPFIVVHEDQVINPAGKQVVYGHIEPTGESVVIVPVDEDGNTYLIRQYRYALKMEAWECAAGRTDGQSVAEAAKRELLEETGLQAEEITVLGKVFLADSTTSFRNTVCLARKLQQVTAQLDNVDGILELRKVAIDEAINEIMAGKIVCGPSISALFMAKAYLEGVKP